MKDYLIIIHKVTMPWIYVCHKLQFDLVQYWATNWTMYTLCNACNGESPWRWWTWGGFLVNFGWIWHPSSFGVCVGQRREGNFDQFQYLPILTIGPRQSTHPSLENFQETRAGWILKRNFFLLRGTFLFCSSFCSAVGVSSVILRIIFQTEFHLTLLISHSSSLLPLSARNWQVLERESYSRGKAQYILQYTSFATHNQIPGICNWQRLPYKSDLKKYSATESLCLQNPIQLVPHSTVHLYFPFSYEHLCLNSLGSIRWQGIRAEINQYNDLERKMTLNSWGLHHYWMCVAYILKSLLSKNIFWVYSPSAGCC